MPTSTSASAESSGSNVPAFLSKLWRLVEDPKYDSVISWSNSGQSFTIHDQTQFAKDVLPLYFKHNNMASFIRQLNMYGFRKVVNVDSGGLKGYKEDIEFYHNFFIRGQEATLEFIKRKAPGHQKIQTTTTTTPAISTVPHDQELRTELVRELLTDVNQLQGKQVKVDTELVDMKRENEALWREVAVLRRKHLKQQRIVEKLIHFLASLVHQARAGNADNNIAMKRKHTLMIDEGGQLRKSFRGAVAPPRQPVTPPQSGISEIDSGPIISDITYEQCLSHPRCAGNRASRRGGPLTTPQPKVAAPAAAAAAVDRPIDESLTSSTADLTDEVVLCDNFFDEEVDLAPSAATVSTSKDCYQPQTSQQKTQFQDFDKFDLEESLNTPRVEDWEAESPTPGTSSKSTAATNSAAGMEVALQNSNKGPTKPENTLSKNKDILDGLKPGFTEASPSRLQSKAVSEWQGDRNLSVAQKLSSYLNDNYIGADQIKRIAEDTNKPTDTLHEHLEGIDTELDWLQDQLLAGGLNIDSNTLMNIFNTDLGNFPEESSNANANSQVVSYQNPSFLDLIDSADDEENIMQLKAK